jgi:hypothetical protein
MYLMRPVAGTEPNRSYVAEFLVEFASAAPSGCAGIGGAPGESVWMKAGATSVQPAPVQENGHTRLSVDKGGQSEGGADAAVIGDVANGIPCEDALSQDPAPYAFVTRRHTLQDPVTAGPDGNVWLVVGTDSGFEGRTSLYYDRIEVRLVPAGGAGESS